MAHEFFAPFSGDRPPLASLAYGVEGSGLVSIESLSESKASFRWKGAPRRDQWPEDSELTVDHDGFRLVIHCGMREQREMLLREISDQVASFTGHEIIFDES